MSDRHDQDSDRATSETLDVWQGDATLSDADLTAVVGGSLDITGHEMSHGICGHEITHGVDLTIKKP